MSGTGERTAPVNTENLQGGPFRKGHSGNPHGRPPGARNRATLVAEALLDGEVEAIMRAAIARAKEGDAAALRLCVGRLVPLRRDRSVSFAMPEIASPADAARAAAALIAGVAAGELTPAEAVDLGKLIDRYVLALEATDFDERLKRLEERAP
jgi:hypothetical protein